MENLIVLQNVNGPVWERYIISQEKFECLKLAEKGFEKVEESKASKIISLYEKSEIWKHNGPQENVAMPGVDFGSDDFKSDPFFATAYLRIQPYSRENSPLALELI